MRWTLSPAILPASFVAWRCASLKYAGTVTTASVIGSPTNSAAISFIFARTIAEISWGARRRSPSLIQASPFSEASTPNGDTRLKRRTSSESKRRPIRRLLAKTVRSGFVTAWRFAIWPTSCSPWSVKATIEGVVREPSAFGMTCGSPPSMRATHEFVVPRSIPITFPIRVLSGKVRDYSSAPSPLRLTADCPSAPSGTFETTTRAGRSIRSQSR